MEINEHAAYLEQSQLVISEPLRRSIKQRIGTFFSGNKFLACWELTARGKSRTWTVHVLLLAHFFPGCAIV